MPTVRSDLDAVQRLLGDADPIGDDGALWSRADLLRWYADGYRALLTQSQAVRRFCVLDVPGRWTATGTSEWEARYASGGSYWHWTWSAPGYECTSLWEVQWLEGVTTQAASAGVSQEWERVFVTTSGVPYRFALPRDAERIAGLWYDHRRLAALEVRELDALERDWRSIGDYPLCWTTGVGRTRTIEVYEIVTTESQGYSQPGGLYGLPRVFSGDRTYTTADSQLYGIARSISSPDRQYLATTGGVGAPRTYHTSVGNLLVLEVVGPEVPDLLETDTPTLIPPQLQKYIVYYTLAQAWSAQGEGQQAALAALCEQRFARGVAFLKTLSWLTRKDTALQRQPAGGQARGRMPRVQLPSTYPRQ